MDHHVWLSKRSSDPPLAARPDLTAPFDSEGNLSMAKLQADRAYFIAENQSLLKTKDELRYAVSNQGNGTLFSSIDFDDFIYWQGGDASPQRAPDRPYHSNARDGNRKHGSEKEQGIM